jgi:hypothetical protein
MLARRLCPPGLSRHCKARRKYLTVGAELGQAIHRPVRLGASGRIWWWDDPQRRGPSAAVYRFYPHADRGAAQATSIARSAWRAPGRSVLSLAGAAGVGLDTPIPLWHAWQSTTGSLAVRGVQNSRRPRAMPGGDGVVRELRTSRRFFATAARGRPNRRVGALPSVSLERVRSPRAPNTFPRIIVCVADEFRAKWVFHR